MFIIECIHSRFPRFKQRHDSVYKIWRQLPTDADLETQHKRRTINEASYSPAYS